MFSFVPRPSHVSNVTRRKGACNIGMGLGTRLNECSQTFINVSYQNSLWKCARKGTYNRYLWLGPLQRPVCIHREGCAGRDRCHQRTGSEWCGTGWTVRERREQEEGWVGCKNKGNKVKQKLCIVGTLVYYHDDALFVEKHPYKAWPIMLAGWCIIKQNPMLIKRLLTSSPSQTPTHYWSSW